MTASTTRIPTTPDMVQTAVFQVQPVGWELMGFLGYLDNRLPDDELIKASAQFREPGDYVIVAWPFETDFDDVFAEKGLDCHFALRDDAAISMRREVKISV